MSLGVVVIGHGSREPAANAELEALVAAWAAARPGREVTVGYVELAQPTARRRAGRRWRARTPRSIVAAAVPLRRPATSRTTCRSRWRRARAAAPRTRASAPPARWACTRRWSSIAFGARARRRARLADAAVAARTAVVVVGRGSSDPDANGDFCKLARLVGEGRGLHALRADASSASPAPLFAETLELVGAQPPRPHRRRALLPLRRPAGRQAARRRSRRSPRATRGSRPTGAAPGRRRAPLPR